MIPGAWRRRTVTETYPGGIEIEETELYWDEDAEPECDTCLDDGRWVAPDGTAQACPECEGR